MSRRLIAMLAVVSAVGAIGSPALAANVIGILSGPDGKPVSGSQIHFEQRVTHDLFLLQTDPYGKFSVDLPPGTYDLRSDRGAMIGSGLIVGDENIMLGNIVDRGGWGNLMLHREGVLEGLVTTPAPSTANLPPFDLTSEVGSPAASSPPAAKSSRVPLVSAPAPAK